MKHLHIFFLPLMAHGHMIPAIDMAKLLCSRGLKTTIISTPAFSEPVKTAQDSGFKIDLVTIRFPHRESGLPDNIVSLDQVTSDEKLLPKFFKALSLIQEPVEELIERLSPSCLISDMFLPWTADSAAKFGIPRLVFHGTSYFSLCVSEQMRRHKPFTEVVSDSEPFLVPNLPHQVKLVKTQVSDYNLNEKKEDDFTMWIQQMRESDARSYGVVVNSFYELEPDYSDHYRRVLGKKAWSIGPLSLCSINGKSQVMSNGGRCLEWLDSKRESSVVYVCFGSMAKFTPSQLNQIAEGLDASGQDFLWVVRNGGDEKEWLPEGFEGRTGGRGLMVRGWAPQVAILEHAAVGAFVTHCGWNSTLEGVCAGVPMVTWPLFAEQFFNEKLVVEVLRVGVSVGNKKWQRGANEGVGGDAVARAVEVVMVGEAAAEMRGRAAECKEMARKAVEEGGSSHNDVTALIQDIAAFVPPGAAK